VIERSFDLTKLIKGVSMVPSAYNEGADYASWLNNPNNFMFVDGDNVGLAQCETPHVYIVHWFFTARGKEALRLGKDMLHELFERSLAKTVMGLTPVENKPARWLAKQIGFKGKGTIQCKFAECEMIFLTKDDFYKGYN
jgi:hypothetical protein